MIRYGRVMATELVFALPARSDELSGGNLYNEQLIRALARGDGARGDGASGMTVSVMSVAECLARVERGTAGFYFIDSLNLEDFSSFPAARVEQHFGLMVHHLPSLEPGVEPANAGLKLERATLPRFDAFLATSPFTAEFLRQRGYDSKKILTVLPAPAVDVETSAVPSPTPPFVFSMVGNLIPRKGTLEFFEWLALHLDETDRFCLELAGRSDLDPGYARACLQLAQGSKLRSIVRYLGPVPHDRIAECYRRAAGFVSTSKMETFGMALQEASAYGLPILAVDGGYARHHFTPGDNGLLFESIEALAQELLALTRDPARMHELFENARRLRRSSDYTWAKAAEIFWQELRRCLERAP
jgi:glycosyltransferase involved in cell wall biosynthesis